MSKKDTDSRRQGSRLSNFKRWVKKTLLRKTKITSTLSSTTITTTTTTTISNNTTTITALKRVPSARRAPVKRSVSASKKRRSRRSSTRRSKSNSVTRKNERNVINHNNHSDHDDFHNKDVNDVNDDDNNYNNNNNYYSDNNYENCVDDEVLNKDELITPIIYSVPLFKVNSEACEISTVMLPSPSLSPPPPSSSSSSSSSKPHPTPLSSLSLPLLSSSSPSFGDCSDDDFLENTCMVKGSVEHFAYVRTLRKIRKDRQRPLNQVVLLNNILEYVSISKLSDKIRNELLQFKIRVYSLNRSRRNSIYQMSDINSRLSYNPFNNSVLSICPSSLKNNRRLSAIMAELNPKIKYRPSYASSKVLTIFDEESDQLVIKELPIARRKRRLSDLSNILIRSTTSSSTSSANSSQSSLVTLTDDVEQHKYCSLSTNEPDNYLSDKVIIRGEGVGDEEDDVPLFVLKEQFKYSGRCHNLSKNNFPLEGNRPRITLAA